MSLRTGSMKTVVVTALVFSIGVGLGVGWKLGWLGMILEPAASGTLAELLAPLEEETIDDNVESDDPWPHARTHSPPELADEQAEPPVEEGINEKAVSIVEASPQIDEPKITAPIIRSSKSQANRPVRRREEARLAIAPVNFQPEPSETAREEVTPREIEEPREPPAQKSPAPKSKDRFVSVDEKLAAGEVLAAHRELSKMYWNAGRPDAELLERLESLAQKIFFSPQPHFIEPYVIQSGDQLRKVAANYKLSWEYLAKLNKTDPRRIREGQKLKVQKGPFAAVVCLHDFSLTIHLQGYFVKRYTVGIGKDGSSPIGKFPVLNKLENPQYTDPNGKVIEGDDPTNPLGERWVDLGNSYGIHGTIDPDSIGKAASRGCIRLRDADIIEVYDFLVLNSIVEIRE